jgi:hypothetical protein
LQHFVTANKFQNLRMSGYIANIKQTTEQSMYGTALEIAVMLGLGAFQVYYLKKVLE